MMIIDLRRGREDAYVRTIVLNGGGNLDTLCNMLTEVVFSAEHGEGERRRSRVYLERNFYHLTFSYRSSYDCVAVLELRRELHNK